MHAQARRSLLEREKLLRDIGIGWNRGQNNPLEVPHTGVLCRVCKRPRIQPQGKERRLHRSDKLPVAQIERDVLLAVRRRFDKLFPRLHQRLNLRFFQRSAIKPHVSQIAFERARTGDVPDLQIRLLIVELRKARGGAAHEKAVHVNSRIVETASHHHRDMLPCVCLNRTRRGGYGRGRIGVSGAQRLKAQHASLGGHIEEPAVCPLAVPQTDNALFLKLAGMNPGRYCEVAFAGVVGVVDRNRFPRHNQPVRFAAEGHGLSQR